ncbi:MAG TPA: ribonuclease Z [Gaiellaceae bacterium]|nr:ribonuclease Z [Gaiellaceae bacterium]
MELDVVFLGTSASAPTARRGTASLLVRRGGDRLLFDCGEGTQRQLLRSSVGLVDLEEIFITHLHADHYLGLPGMLKTFSLRMRDVPLTVYGPVGLRELYDALGRVFGRLTYPVELVEVRAGDRIAHDGYELCVFPVAHGVPAVGYALVEEERPGRFDESRADALGVPFGPERGRLQRGEAVTLADGSVVQPEQLVGEARAGRTVVYTGDTRPAEVVATLFPAADLLIHEATFAEEDRDRARDTGHSTAHEAAEIARAAGVSLLALTHVSPRYLGSELLREAREVFPSTVMPRDFDVIELPFPERGEPALVKGGAHPDRAREETPTT